VGGRHALVAGATGLVGKRIAGELHDGGWQVTGVCRRLPPAPLPYRLVSADLTDAHDCRAKLGVLHDVTHLFYAARYDHPEGESESIDTNAAMFANLLDAVEPAAADLRHVHLVHGTKYYGHMLGPLQALPLSEESPRARVPNFYFAQEDFVRARQRGRAWTFSTSRPHTFCDAWAAEPRNAALLIAVHASIAREVGEPFFYPGSDASFGVRTQFTFVPLLARAVSWMATTAACANQSYNIVNGDAPRWSGLWPAFAEFFGVEVGARARVGLSEYMAAKSAVWDTLVRRHGLEPVALTSRVLWPYADYLFAPEWDIISGTSKARRDGFTDRVDSARMFLDLFERFRRDKIIP
jgi:nucleoside-diphosphate-sugar epimerase